MKTHGSFRFFPDLLTSLLAITIACTKSTSPTFEVGKPVFEFNYENTQELLISKRDPESPFWSARFIKDGWIGPQQVTPRWVIKQPPEGNTLSDFLADGGFIQHFLDSLKTLRKVSSPPEARDADIGLDPPWTTIEWKEDQQTFLLELGAPYSSGGRYARIHGQRLVVEGAALEMLRMLNLFQRIRHQRLFLWILDDADRVQLRWKSQFWAAERSTGDWIKMTPKGGKAFSQSPSASLEALAHLQIASFDLDPKLFQTPMITIEWIDRKNRRLQIEIDSELRAKSSDRPHTIFQLYPESRSILDPSRFPK